MDVVVVDGERRREASSNPVVKWRFGIKYGSRTENMLVSTKMYNSADAARKAGLRQLKVIYAAAKKEVE